MNKLKHLPSVRLAASGCVSLVLLAWIGFMPLWLPPVTSLFDRVCLIAVAVAAGLSAAVLAILAPVVWHGPRRDRWLALLLAPFPLLVFSVTSWWLGAWTVYR